MILGDLLYRDTSAFMREHDWIGLVDAVAANDQFALHALYEQAHRAVFTLIMRIVGQRQAAEDLTVDVFCHVWRRSSGYDSAAGTVLGWIMNLARAKAIEKVRPRASPAPGVRNSLELNPQGKALLEGLSNLTSAEHEAIETVFFSETTLAETAERLQQPLALLKQHIRSGLHKLRRIGSAGEREMTTPADTNLCGQAEHVCAHAMQALSPRDAYTFQLHLRMCQHCRREFEELLPLIDSFVFWPTDVLRPSAALQERLALRIAAEAGKAPALPAARQWPPPVWEEVAPGIFCKLLAADAEKHQVSMLVRLAPGVHYPPHTHAGIEELHLLDGELYIDGRKLVPGDYNRAEPGSGDESVWSETGCTCVLITSTNDTLHA